MNEGERWWSMMQEARKDENKRSNADDDTDCRATALFFEKVRSMSVEEALALQVVCIVYTRYDIVPSNKLTRRKQRTSTTRRAKRAVRAFRRSKRSGLTSTPSRHLLNLSFVSITTNNPLGCRTNKLATIFLNNPCTMPNPLNRFTKAVEDSLPDDLSMITDVLEDENYRLQLTAFIVFFTTLLVLRISSTARLKALKGEHVLDLSNLNDANLFKEVFLAYLNAAILEPLLAIGGLEAAEGAQVLINLLTLGSICWWIWLITDAFDFEDVTQFFKYHVELRAEQEEEKDPARFSWLRLKDTTEDARLERKVLSGSVSRDVAVSGLLVRCVFLAFDSVVGL